jgi:TetR/AcrR family transcriptional regulator, tetracycline repressor protein
LYICQVANKADTRLSRETVADGALALADAIGLEALTVRRLATELGVTPMALYWHFKNKEELLDGVADRIWDQVDCTRDLDKPLLEQFRALAQSLIDALRRHRALVPLLLGPRDSEPSPGFLETTEVALRILLDAGLDLETAVNICQNCLRTATALVLGEPGAPGPQQSPDDIAEMIRRKRLRLESLPIAKYPLVVQAASPLTSCADPDAHYAFGLDFVMSAISALIPPGAAEN